MTTAYKYNDHFPFRETNNDNIHAFIGAGEYWVRGQNWCLIRVLYFFSQFDA
jgi:hypothetical protein